MTPDGAAFTGFPERALSFYEGLEADNSRAYWSDHRAVYDECVAAPLRALLDALGPEFGEAKVFRPYRDVRFSKDKSPYKTQAAAAVGDERSGRAGLYLQLSAEGLSLAGGMYAVQTDQVQRLREAVADDATGPALVAALDDLRGRGWSVEGRRLVRVPKPWGPGHPRADLLRHRSLYVWQSLGADEWLHTREALDRVTAAWRELAHFGSWLGRHVGPSREPARR